MQQAMDLTTTRTGRSVFSDFTLDSQEIVWHSGSVKLINNTHEARVHSVANGSRHLYVVPQRQTPRESYVPAGRTLHLVDVENLMGGPDAGANALHGALAHYRSAASVADGDHVIVGANPQIGIQAKAAWPSARLVVRPGPDGADIALLKQVKEVDFIAARYDRIMIGSGDGVFEAVVTEFRSLGIPVGVSAAEEAFPEFCDRPRHTARPSLSLRYSR